jgi:hypothetical protein
MTSPADQLVEFVAGLYYSKANNYDEIFQAGNLGYLPAFAADARYQRITIDQRSLAAFGQATIHATDQLSFIEGTAIVQGLIAAGVPADTLYGADGIASGRWRNVKSRAASTATGLVTSRLRSFRL